MTRPGNPDDEMPFHLRKKGVTDEQIGQSWQSIHGQLGNTPPKQLKARTLLLITSVVLFAAFSALLLSPGFFRYKTIETAYGEIENIRLPDGSEVVLNSNSQLRYPRNWKEGERTVWLMGEAFFKVEKKTVTRAKFTVHTSQLDVEVLGTVFNVDAGSPDQTEVALTEGKVLIRPRDNISDGSDSISMEPGDVVVVNENSFHKTKDNNIGQRSSWINNDFHFENTPLSEIKAIIERKYGYPVTLGHDSLRQITLSGNMHAENFEQFTKALEITLKLDVSLKNGTVILKQLR